MIRSSFFTLLGLFILAFTASACDGDEVDLTNTEIDPPMIEVEAGTISYTFDGQNFEDTGFSFVCRTDSLSPGMFHHSYVATNVDVSGLSDTSLVFPVVAGDLNIGGYTDDVTAIEGAYLYFLVDVGSGEPVLSRCFDCPITMVEDDGVLSGSFSGTLTSTSPDSSFVITNGVFEVPLIEYDCN